MYTGDLPKEVNTKSERILCTKIHLHYFPFCTTYKSLKSSVALSLNNNKLFVPINLNQIVMKTLRQYNKCHGISVNEKQRHKKIKQKTSTNWKTLARDTRKYIEFCVIIKWLVYFGTASSVFNYVKSGFILLHFFSPHVCTEGKWTKFYL